jgi:hypothetical protein
MKSVYFKSAITLAVTAAFLVACGGDPAPAPTPAASTNTSANVTATTVAAVTGKAFSFPSGVAALGTTGATTLTVTDAAVDTFAVSSPAGSYSGNLTYGSCIFQITTSTFAAPSPFAVGQTFTVATCSVSAATSGVAANGQSNNLPVTFNLGGTNSTAQNLAVVIAADGSVTIGGAPVGKVVVVTPTGG